MEKVQKRGFIKFCISFSLSTIDEIDCKTFLICDVCDSSGGENVCLVFWVFALCALVGRHQRLRETLSAYLYLQP
jgi:hypothetical protein